MPDDDSTPIESTTCKERNNENNSDEKSGDGNNIRIDIDIDARPNHNPQDLLLILMGQDQEMKQNNQNQNLKKINEVNFRSASSHSLTESWTGDDGVDADADEPASSKIDIVSTHQPTTTSQCIDIEQACQVENQTSFDVDVDVESQSKPPSGPGPGKLVDNVWPDRSKNIPRTGKGKKRTGRLLRLWLWYKQRIQPFRKIAISQIICMIYILVLTFSHPPIGIKDPITNDIIDPNSTKNTNDGVIYLNGSYRPVVAIGTWQKFCLAISRMSAFSMYPMLVVVFVTKMKALQSFFSKTPLSMYFGVINEGHDFHVYAGKYIAFDVWLHTLFHMLRWASQGNIKLLWTSAAGISGLVTMIATPLITFPMMYYKNKLSYEMRKGLHYLFYIFAIAMCFHVPTTAIPNGGFIAPILGSCIALYTLDALYVYLFMSEKIETTAFYVLSSGVRISMPVSERFQKQAGRAGFAYINLPWINDKQWHPFSLFEDPSDPSMQQMFLMKSGDWTNAVHTALSRDTTRPCWIQGPFPSPYSHASLYDNQILVASGIGITPALAAINAFKSSRRVNLIWAVRDPEMLEFFLEHLYLDHDGWNLIFYTGKTPLASSIGGSNTNVRVIRGRPQLASVIPNVIYGIESKEGLPEKYTPSSKDEMKHLIMNRMSELDMEQDVRATDKVAEIREYGEALGFSLSDMINQMYQSMAARRMSSMESFSERDGLQSSAAEDDAKNFLEDLKLSMRSDNFLDDPQLSMRSGKKYLRQTSDDSLSLLMGTEGTVHEPLRRRGRRCKKPRSTSFKRWSNMRKEVGQRDSNALLTPAFCPWNENKAQERCVERLDDEVKSTWGIMYCGGSEAVILALREISIDYNIDLHVDSFAW